MADTKVSALTPVTTPAGTDEIPVNQAGTSKKVTLAQVLAYLQGLGHNRVKRVNTIHSNSTVTGTEVTDLTIALEAGTYMFEYCLITRSATITTGIYLGVNFTGTAAVKTMMAYWADASTSLLAEVHQMDDQGNLAFGFISGMANKAYTTTAPNMGTSVGHATAASDTPMWIKGILIVTVAGNLALWHGSETTTATTVEVGSSLVVQRTA
jgi:hypothetical protein